MDGYLLIADPTIIICYIKDGICKGSHDLTGWFLTHFLVCFMCGKMGFQLQVWTHMTTSIVCGFPCIFGGKR